MLRVSRRPDTGTLWITGTVRPAGAAQGVRVRRRAGTDDPALAREEAAALEAEILRTAWHGPRGATVGFDAAALSYLKHEPRSEGTLALVRALSLHFKATPCTAIDQAAVDRARDTILRPGAKPATVKRNLIAPLRAVLMHAAKRGWCPAPRFDIPAEPKGRTLFLLPHQVEALIAGAADHLRPLLRFLVCTGCRAGEALGLEWTEVDLQGARVILYEDETKSGRFRKVDLPPAAVAALAELKERKGRVFRDQKRRPYGGEGSPLKLRTAWATACREAGLPGETRKYRQGTRLTRDGKQAMVSTFHPQHTPHTLRHTWATWHYALHKDLLLLARDGGWASTVLVERYAHLMPAGQEATIHATWGILSKQLIRPQLSASA